MLDQMFMVLMCSDHEPTELGSHGASLGKGTESRFRSRMPHFRAGRARKKHRCLFLRRINIFHGIPDMTYLGLEYVPTLTPETKLPCRYNMHASPMESLGIERLAKRVKGFFFSER